MTNIFLRSNDLISYKDKEHLILETRNHTRNTSSESAADFKSMQENAMNTARLNVDMCNQHPVSPTIYEKNCMVQLHYRKLNR